MSPTLNKPPNDLYGDFFYDSNGRYAGYLSVAPSREAYKRRKKIDEEVTAFLSNLHIWNWTHSKSIEVRKTVMEAVSEIWR